MEDIGKAALLKVSVRTVQITGRHFTRLAQRSTHQFFLNRLRFLTTGLPL